MPDDEKSLELSELEEKVKQQSKVSKLQSKKAFRNVKIYAIIFVGIIVSLIQHVPSNYIENSFVANYLILLAVLSLVFYIISIIYLIIVNSTSNVEINISNSKIYDKIQNNQNKKSFNKLKEYAYLRNSIHNKKEIKESYNNLQLANLIFLLSIICFLLIIMLGSTDYLYKTYNSLFGIFISFFVVIICLILCFILIYILEIYDPNSLSSSLKSNIPIFRKYREINNFNYTKGENSINVYSIFKTDKTAVFSDHIGDKITNEINNFISKEFIVSEIKSIKVILDGDKEIDLRTYQDDKTKNLNLKEKDIEQILNSDSVKIMVENCQKTFYADIKTEFKIKNKKDIDGIAIITDKNFPSLYAKKGISINDEYILSKDSDKVYKNYDKLTQTDDNVNYYVEDDINSNLNNDYIIEGELKININLNKN